MLSKNEKGKLFTAVWVSKATFFRVDKLLFTPGEFKFNIHNDRSSRDFCKKKKFTSLKKLYFRQSNFFFYPQNFFSIKSLASFRNIILINMQFRHKSMGTEKKHFLVLANHH